MNDRNVGLNPAQGTLFPLFVTHINRTWSPSRVRDQQFGSQSSQTNGLKIDSYRFLASHLVLLGRIGQRLAGTVSG